MNKNHKIFRNIYLEDKLSKKMNILSKKFFISRDTEMCRSKMIKYAKIMSYSCVELNTTTSKNSTERLLKFIRTNKFTKFIFDFKKSEIILDNKLLFTKIIDILNRKNINISFLENDCLPDK